ncbi:MAG: class C sortase [Coriobacteriia bacterium]|nr:class C sortase [Coriobacteriia bacterium]
MHARPARKPSLPIRLHTAIAALILLLGVGVVLSPYLSDAQVEAAYEREVASISDIRAAIRQGAKQSGGEQVRYSYSTETYEAARDFQASVPLLEQYNQSLLLSDQRLNDPFEQQAQRKALKELGLRGDLIGSIRIPKIHVKLPLRYGASKENLERGAAIIAGSSFPLGETSSNCVIAAHRTSARSFMLRNIERMHAGDRLIIETPWARMTYKLTKKKIIDPGEVNTVTIQPGKDMATLVTCHPYSKSTYRLVLFFERANAEDSIEYHTKTSATKIIGVEDAGSDEPDASLVAYAAGGLMPDQADSSTFAEDCLLAVSLLIATLAGIYLVVSELAHIRRTRRTSKPPDKAPERP